MVLFNWGWPDEASSDDALLVRAKRQNFKKNMD